MALVANISVKDYALGELDELDKDVNHRLEEYELAIAERTLQLKEAADILGISSQGVNKWGLRKGITLVELYDFVRTQKPRYVAKVENYIRRIVRGRLNALPRRT